VNTTLIRAVLAIFILAQLAILLMPRNWLFGRDRYRATELAAAAKARHESPSAETERAWQQELSLRQRHRALTGLSILGVFVVVNGLLCYRFWNYGRHEIAA